MARLYPALDLSWPAPPSEELIDETLARLDESSPTAVEERPLGIRVFFTTDIDRQQAAAYLRGVDDRMTCTAVNVSDEDWAARSQASLGPIRVGRIVVTPPHAAGTIADRGTVEIVIEPSMGFGTGHHASTRLCLALLQELPIAGWRVLDVGTGSGVLAIAASKLGASDVVGIDNDPDALEAAQDGIRRNGVTNTTLRLQDVPGTSGTLGTTGTIGTAGTDWYYDLTLANLTGATLIRLAGTLANGLSLGGSLIASGFQTHEESDVVEALQRFGLITEARVVEDDWVAMRSVRRT